ncbi:hypothetical protein I302_100804 [Kwoniella bestiolae CBS 10118]|uniref:Uncharacterized protein n=1 Tax=Kwoniella bestiolae CBS 10118 TaxID=1296100 RepID=A0A1B9G666_9TREE|nr:hypothetical protein I302_04177 [Kwoniella bestiolae CBS 10118]OCF26491.1 hypothetical protein I302_04177 [Kwoniella bestiolae CBS 10118]
MPRTLYHVFIDRQDELNDDTDLIASYWTYAEAKKKAKAYLFEEWGDEDDFESLEEKEKDGVYEIYGTGEEGEEYRCYTSAAEVDSPPPKEPTSKKGSKKRSAPSPPPASSSTAKRKTRNSKSNEEAKNEGVTLYSVMREDSTSRYNGDGSYDTETYKHGIYTSWGKAREAALELVESEFDGDGGDDDYEEKEVVNQDGNFEFKLVDLEGNEYRIWVERREVKGKKKQKGKGKGKGKK